MSCTEVSQQKIPKTIIDNVEWKATIPAKNLPSLAFPPYNINPIPPFPFAPTPEATPLAITRNFADSMSKQN